MQLQLKTILNHNNSDRTSPYRNKLSVNELFQFFLTFIKSMIQNYQNDPLLHNYLAPSYPLFIQIKSLIHAFASKKTVRNAKTDIIQLASKLGPEGERFVLTTLLETIEAREFKEKPQASVKIVFLAELLKDYTVSEPFLSYFPEIITTLVSDPLRYSEYFSNILMGTKLSVPQQITMALSLYLSDIKELAEVGQDQLQRKLKELRALGKRGSDLPDRVLDELLFQFSTNASLQEKLQQQFEYLLQTSENPEKVPSLRMLNYLNGDWQYFANQQPIIDKPPPVIIRKCDLLRDLGPAGTASPDTLRLLLGQLGPINEEEAMDCLLMMSEERLNSDAGIQKFVTDLLVASKKNLKSEELKKIYGAQLNGKKGQPVGWNIQNFIAYCSQTVPNFKWQNVYLQLDRPKLTFKSQEAFMALIKSLQKIRKQGNNKFKIPDQIFFKRWNNPQSQGNFLIQVLRCKEPEVLGLNQLPNRRIQKSVKDCNSLAKQIWGYIDLVQLLVEVSDYNYLEIRELFDIPMNKHPQLLIQTLAEIRPSRGQPLLDEIFSQIFPSYLHNHSNNIRLLQNLWEANQQLVISCICELYKSQSKKQNSLNLSRVLDIAQVIKESLIPLTNWNDYQFAVPLAILAGKRQFLHFEPWITDRIKNAGNPFLKATLAYIEDHLLVPIRKYIQTNEYFNYEVVLQKAQLSKQLLAFIFESIFLTTSSNKMTKRNLESLKRIYKEVCLYFPQMSESQMPDQIQQLAQRQFIKIYKKQITIEEAIEHMRKLKNSPKPQEKELFASMITFMYSELRFHISYPENELLITADLFAGIINQGLIDKKLIQVLLQVLEDDLKQDNKKYTFAKIVIEKIKSKLINEGQFCQKLLDNAYLMQKDPQLIEGLLKAVQPPVHLSVEKEKRLKEAIKIKNTPPEPIIMVAATEEQVPEDKKTENYDFDILIHLDKSKEISISLGEKDNKLTKINTICNTLSLSNIDEKAKDLEKIIDSKSALLLLSYNIVFKRIPLAAQNNAGVQIFYRLVQKLPKIQPSVRKLTYKILQAWFALTEKSVNDKKISNFKSIAFWLGKLTIGKGTAILINKINIRQILVNTYTLHSCRLALNVSVILKMLQQIVSWKQVFRPTNPWLGRILGTLNEIEQKLKQQHQNTKSQIKAFFINTDIKKSSSLISTSYLDKNQFPLISRLPEYIKISEDMHSYYKSRGIDLKMLITKAVDDSIQQIVEPVIDRAVKIAIVTAKQLVLKDFALESNADRFKTSFSNVVKKLAGPLAQVTCRQPLKASMNRTLKTYLAQSIADQTQVESIITKAIPDNLDLGCALIKKAVIQSAEEAIRKDEAINQSIQKRTAAVAQGKQFRDEAFLREIPGIVPDELRPKIGGLSLEQFLVYDEFRKERKDSTPQTFEMISNSDKLTELFSEKGAVKSIRDLIVLDSVLRDELIQKLYGSLKEIKEEGQLQYYLQICEMLKEFMEPQQAWTLFKERADITKKQISNLVRKLVRDKFFLQSCLSELDEGNQEQQKAISMFQKWLDTARQEIEPFLQSLEQIFNKSQNQIRNFFQYSLSYALQKVQNSISPYHQSIDSTYIQNYSKLIIISYKLIASNNSSIFLQHTLQAILSIFNKSFTKQAKTNHQRAFLKLFLNLICDATRKEYDFHKDKVTSFYYILARQLHKINPSTYPAFSFAWVQIISNKYFMPNLLQKYEYWDCYYELICDLFKFAKENLTQQGLIENPPCQVFYKGMLRIIILLVHDYPDFLSAFSLQLCLNIPEKFIQARNILLSAHPKQLKFRSPKAISNREQLDKESNISILPKYYHIKFDKAKYNQFISLFQNNDKSLKQKLQSQNDETLQVFVLYFAWLQQCQLSVTNSRKLLIDIVFSLQGDLKQKLIKYALNLIRYPNSITSYFIDFVITIVFKSNNEKTRNLLLSKMFERINVESAHPWGILYLVNQFQIQKNELTKLQIPKQILNRL